MELANTELLETAKKLESEKLAKIKFDPARIIDLDGLLGDIYDKQCPKPVDYHNRKDLIRIFNLITKEIYGHNENSPVVKEYGSFVMDIFNERSDLDLSVTFSNSIEVTRQKQKETLRKFSGKLRSIQRNGHVTGLQCILTAEVPIIKVTDSGTGIECDLSVDNRDGIAKSHIIRVISAIDERFQKLSFLMKSWAKAHNINSSKDATLNSFSIILFVALHLQTRNPPILPPFSALLEAVTDPESAAEIVKPYINYGKQNKESPAILFITLLVKLASVENLWQNGLCASLYKGSWISKSWMRSYSISVEDFTDRSQNVARAVGSNGFKMIYKCIHKSLNHISQFLNGQIQGVELMDHLFGTHAVSNLGVPVTINFRENKKNHPTLQNPRPSKKKCLVESGMHLPSGKNVQHSRDSNTPSIPNQSPFINPNTNVKVQTSQNFHASFTPSFPSQSLFVNPSTNIKVQTLQNSHASFTPSIPHNSHFDNPSTNTKAQTVQSSHAFFTPSIPHNSHFDNPSTNTKAQTVQSSHTFFTPSVPYQSPFDNPSTNIKVRHGYGLGYVPPPFGLNPIVFERSYNPPVQSHVPPPFGLNPIVFERSYNPSVQSHVLSQSSGGFVQPFHHKAVDSNSPYHGSFTSSSQQGKGLTFYNQRHH